MSRITGLDIPLHFPGPGDQQMRLVQVHRPLRRLLAVAGRTLDDVVNCPIAKNQVLGYYKLHRQVERAGEIGELERWWRIV
jgi:hypothetical protein